MWRMKTIWRYLENLIIKSSMPQGVVLGKNCRILRKPRISVTQGARIELGDGVVLNSLPEGYHAAMSFPVTLHADRPGASIKIGEYSRLNGCCIHAWSQITVGRKCLFAAGSQVIDAHGHETDLRYARLWTQMQDEPDPISIGDYCWIGLGALVLKGAKIGEGCLVAAHSVVMAGDYPAFSLIAGSPAKVVRRINEDDVLPEDYRLDPLVDRKKIRTI